MLKTNKKERFCSFREEQCRKSEIRIQFIFMNFKIYLANNIFFYNLMLNANSYLTVVEHSASFPLDPSLHH